MILQAVLNLNINFLPFNNLCYLILSRKLIKTIALLLLYKYSMGGNIGMVKTCFHLISNTMATTVFFSFVNLNAHMWIFDCCFGSYTYMYILHYTHIRASKVLKVEYLVSILHQTQISQHNSYKEVK